MGKAIFRVDASLHIGTGHVMRCLTLANALKLQGWECEFICRAHSGNLIGYVQERGFLVRALPVGGDHSTDDWLGVTWQTDAEQSSAVMGETPADWLIVDHYVIDRRWENAMQRHCKNLMVIDDLADRKHECDLLLDQNLGRAAADYAGLVNSSCDLLIGPKFALLRPEFAALRDQSLLRRAKPALKTILITMGGVDKDNATGDILEALKDAILPGDLNIVVVMGPTAPWLKAVKEQAKTMPWPTEILVNVKNMAQLMAQSDLAIGAAGSTSWERCCLGLPSLMLVLADNQYGIAQALRHVNAAYLIGEPSDTCFMAKLTCEMHKICASLSSLMEMSVAAAKVTDGKGAQLVIEKLSAENR